MDITNINLGTCPLQYLSIGYVGETGARPVAFDFSAWATEYGSGVLQLLLLRPGDADPYPVVLDIDGTTAVWTPDATDTAAQGQGQAQLVYTVGGVIVKNAIFRVLIAPSLGAAGDPPEPYEDWLERLTELAAETQQNALDAAESAEAAGTSAGAAAVSAGSAAQSALDAEAAKADAEAAETAAGQSAAAAAEKAAQAAQAAQTAEQSALDAAESAAEAEQSAGDAAAAKTDAETAKTAAETAATAAGVSAGSAAEKAAQAAQSAQTAGQGASAAQQSATDAQAALEAAQLAADAAGTFADDAEESKTAAAQSAALAALAKTDAETAATDAAASEASAAASAAVAQELIDQIPDIEAEFDGKAPAIYASAGPAAVVTVTDGAEDMPIRTLTVTIDPVQSGSGDPSTENVRPFTARTAVSVTRTGESLIGGEALADSIKAGMPAATIDRTAQTVTFTGRTNGDNDKTLALVPLVDGQRCTAILNGSGNINNVRWQYTDGTIDASSRLPAWGGAYVSIAGKTVRRLVKVYNSASQTVLNYGTSCILAGVKTAADFQPYEGEVVDVDWTDTAGAIYAGTLTLNADGSAELAALPHYASYAGETLVGPWVSSMDVYAEGTTPTTGAEVVDLGGSATVYQLTAEQIKALAGVNNIWSNAGDVTVEYPADTKSYVDGKTAAINEQIDTLTDDVDALEGDVADLSALPIISPPDVETLVEDGEYTDEAKIALQKALGIYEAPWELIREDTFTNASEANHTVTTDADGQAFVLTDVIFQFEMPSQSTEAKFGGSGSISLKALGYSASVIYECGGYTQTANASAHGCTIVARQANKMLECYRVGSATVSNNGTMTGRYGAGFAQLGDTDRVTFALLDAPATFVSLTIRAVTGTGHYKLYGRRKWQ